MVVTYEKHGNVGLFTLNRPEARNAVSHEVSSELEAHLDNFESDDDAWVGILAASEMCIRDRERGSKPRKEALPVSSVTRELSR